MSSTKVSKRQRVLFTVLDWGLGHATRSISVIRKLNEQQCDVLIASSGDALRLLKAEFPGHDFFELTPYNARYSNSIPLILKLLLQVPKFLSTIRKEHLEVQSLIEENKIDIVISDNRYGCWARGIQSVFITHQVNLRLPKPLGWFQPLVRRSLARWIGRFDVVWIPDENHKLTGALTSPLPRDFRFIGILSRFRGREQAEASNYDFVAVLSGPQPQRTLLEKRIASAAAVLKLKALIVRGVYNDLDHRRPTDKGITFINHCDSNELEDIVNGANLIVCRSGYSSVMDLAFIQKDKVLFVPTPGQTEQEYLAKLLSESGIAPFQRQDDLDLVKGFDQVKNYSGFVGWTNDSNLLESAIRDLLK